MTDKLHRFCITLDVYPDVFRAALPIDSDFLCEIAVYRIRSPGAAFGAGISGRGNRRCVIGRIRRTTPQDIKFIA